jgi:hypothetical protein
MPNSKNGKEGLSRRDAIKKLLLLPGAAPLVFFALSKSIKNDSAGWGRCSVSGCPCAGFVQTYGSELCSNCGHQYSAHW